jgi:pyrimidine-nucleoside phosphorylase
VSADEIVVTDLIEKKAMGEALSPVELAFLVDGYTAGQIPDYQMSAFCMAVRWRGMNLDEIEAMTRAMIATGQTVDLAGIGRPTVDKHSTGGVGDKITLVVAPLAASLGVAVPKLSGRGLGHTGGTLDKLESIPGFRIDLSIAELVSVCRETGVVVASPTADIVPADRQIYALRDVTSTVASLPLGVSSIMSKKLAVKTDAIVLDVKVGEGALFPTLEEARAFGLAAKEVGSRFGRAVRCVLSSMDQPLGRAVGNLLEVREAIATLQGEGPPDLVEVAMTVATEMVLAADPSRNAEEVREGVVENLSGGAAHTVFERWIARQGGDLMRISEAVGGGADSIPVTARESGYVTQIHARAIGRLAMALGAGRPAKGATIDPSAGVLLDVSVGDAVAAGDRLARLYTAGEERPDRWVEAARNAIALSPDPPRPHPLILGIL